MLTIAGDRWREKSKRGWNGGKCRGIETFLGQIGRPRSSLRERECRGYSLDLDRIKRSSHQPLTCFLGRYRLVITTCQHKQRSFGVSTLSDSCWITQCPSGKIMLTERNIRFRKLSIT